MLLKKWLVFYWKVAACLFSRTRFAILVWNLMLLYSIESEGQLYDYALVEIKPKMWDTYLLIFFVLWTSCWKLNHYGLDLWRMLHATQANRLCILCGLVMAIRDHMTDSIASKVDRSCYLGVILWMQAEEAIQQWQKVTFRYEFVILQLACNLLETLRS